MTREDYTGFGIDNPLEEEYGKIIFTKKEVPVLINISYKDGKQRRRERRKQERDKRKQNR